MRVQGGPPSVCDGPKGPRRRHECCPPCLKHRLRVVGCCEESERGGKSLTVRWGKTGRETRRDSGPEGRPRLRPRRGRGEPGTNASLSRLPAPPTRITRRSERALPGPRSFPFRNKQKRTCRSEGNWLLGTKFVFTHCSRN